MHPNVRLIGRFYQALRVGDAETTVALYCPAATFCRLVALAAEPGPHASRRSAGNRCRHQDREVSIESGCQRNWGAPMRRAIGWPVCCTVGKAEAGLTKRCCYQTCDVDPGEATSLPIVSPLPFGDMGCAR